MKESLPTALTILASPYVLVLSWIATVLLGVVLGRLGSRMQGGGQQPDLIELELTLRRENFTHILKSWAERAGFAESVEVFRRHTQLDMSFALFYPVALASLLAACLGTAPLMGAGTVALFILGVVLAGLLDALVENRSYLRIIAGLSSPEDLDHIEARHIQTAFAGAAAKWLLLAIALLAILGGLTSKFLGSQQGRILAWALPLVAFLLVAFYSRVLFPRAAQEYRGGQGKNVVALQLSFTKTRFVEILSTWIQHSPSEDAVEAFRRQLRRLDYAFPILYALLFASLAFVLLGPVKAKAPVLFGLAFWLPMAAALFDMLENTTHYIILQRVTEDSLASVPAAPIFWASVFAALKFLALLVFLALAVLLFLGR